MEYLRGGRAGGRLGGRDGGLDTRALRLRGPAGARGRGRAALRLRGTGKGETGAAAGGAGDQPLSPPSWALAEGALRRMGKFARGAGTSRSYPTCPFPAPPPSSSDPSGAQAPSGQVPGSPRAARQKEPGLRRRDAEGVVGEGRGWTKGLLRKVRGLVSGRVPSWPGVPRFQSRHHRLREANTFPSRKGGERRRETAEKGATPPPRPAGSRALPLARLRSGLGADRRLLIHSAAELGAPEWALCWGWGSGTGPGLQGLQPGGSEAT